MPVPHYTKLSVQCQHRNSIALRARFLESGHCVELSRASRSFTADIIPIYEGIIEAKLENEIAQLVLNLTSGVFTCVRIRSKHAQ